jgi:hypothetical protein
MLLGRFMSNQVAPVNNSSSPIRYKKCAKGWLFAVFGSVYFNKTLID